MHSKMKLTDTTNFQQDEGHLYGEPSLSISFSVRDEEDGELIEKDFEFSYAREWDKWTISNYKEKRCDADVLVSKRNWRTVEDVFWHEMHHSECDIDIPQYVIDKLDEVLGADVVKLQF